MNKLLIISLLTSITISSYGQITSSTGKAVKTPVQKNFFLGSFSFIQVEEQNGKNIASSKDAYKRMSGEGFRNYYTSYAISSTKPHKSNLKMAIYPNYKKGSLVIQGKKNKQFIAISVKDSFGKIVNNKSFSQEIFSFEQDLNAIKTDIFFIEVSGKDGNEINTYVIEPAE
ncbi:hypothetical protein R9C00_22025 [Flammeovirgaceae bacterium SG7u.111]|nr:hypothetical protein [Flammeovirgaceae bacterium SG7u.132]WPO34382.1 hypothetical protein R9C00_22025 [Flammeovirgaceae bacterium SG7u.111]